MQKIHAKASKIPVKMSLDLCFSFCKKIMRKGRTAKGWTLIKVSANFIKNVNLNPAKALVASRKHPSS